MHRTILSRGRPSTGWRWAAGMLALFAACSNDTEEFGNGPTPVSPGDDGGSSLDGAAPLARTPFTDDFNGTAQDLDPFYGLNDALASRQKGASPGTTYTRTPTTAPWTAQVGHPKVPGTLSFWGAGAVRLDAEVIAAATAPLTIRTTIDPKTDDIAGDASAFISLATNSKSAGLPGANDTLFSVSVSSRGTVRAYLGDRVIGTAEIPAKTTYDVELTLSANSRLTVGGLDVPLEAIASPPRHAFLFLGATEGVSTFEQLEVSTLARFTDRFEGSSDVDPGYGLNDRLGDRQAPVENDVTCSRLPSLFGTATPPSPWHAQVNHPNYPGTLSFALIDTAVRLDAPVSTTAATGTFLLGLTATPPVNGAVILGLSPLGAPKSSVEMDIALRIEESGAVQIYEKGVSRALGSVAKAASYRVELATIGAREGSPSDGAARADVVVNGTSFRTDLAHAISRRSYLFLEAHLPDDKAVATIDDLEISDVARAPALTYYGYWGARWPSSDPAESGAVKNHLGEVAGFSNLNMVWTRGPGFVPDKTALDACAPGSCVIYVGEAIFSGCYGGGPASGCKLDVAGATTRYAEVMTALEGSIAKIGAVYVMDEPYSKGVVAADMDAAVDIVKNHPLTANLPAMFVLDPVTLNTATHIPAKVDWVGFDLYCSPIGAVEGLLSTLEGRLTGTQRTFLIPESLPNIPGCGAGHDTDAALAAIQWDYFNLARRHPSVIGMMNWGIWVAGPSFPAFPQMGEAQQRIANAVLFR